MLKHFVASAASIVPQIALGAGISLVREALQKKNVPMGLAGAGVALWALKK